MFKAFLIDSDDTLTRTPGSDIYHRASYAAYKSLHPNQMMDFEEFCTFRDRLFATGDCQFTLVANHFGFDPVDMFKAHHDHMEFDLLAFDCESVLALEQIKKKSVIFTDASYDWGYRCGTGIGHTLDILARDDNGTFAHRKAFGEERWFAVLDVLKEKTGLDLKPQDVAMIDDSTGVLQQARKLGFGTVLCHWGHVGREHTTEFDFSIGSVGDFLIEQGYASVRPAAQNPESLPVLRL